jgi:hypothetical protein
MRDRLRTYTAYSIGCATVWVLLIIVGVATGKTSAQHTVLYVIGPFGQQGWSISARDLVVCPRPAVSAQPVGVPIVLAGRNITGEDSRG